MTERRRTPLQRAETRHAAELDQDTDEFRSMTRRRQDAEEKLRRHLEGERDGRPVPHDETPDASAGAGASTATGPGAATPDLPARAPDPGSDG